MSMSKEMARIKVITDLMRLSKNLATAGRELAQVNENLAKVTSHQSSGDLFALCLENIDDAQQVAKSQQENANDLATDFADELRQGRWGGLG